MLHNLFPQKVRLEEETHQYFDQLGREYVSFSKLFSFLSPKFDADNIAYHVGKRDGVSSQEVLDGWQKQTDFGTRIDNALTLYAATGQILKEDECYQGLIKKVLEKYAIYNKCYSQVVVYSEKYRVAGSMDKLSLISNRKTSGFIISDFKCFEKGISNEYKGTKWLAEPFDYMINSKFNKIAFQTSFYAVLFEWLTGRKCEGLFIDLIIPVKENGKIKSFRNQVINLNYLRPQVELLLETYKNKILSLVEPKAQIEIEDEF